MPFSHSAHRTGDTGIPWAPGPWGWSIQTLPRISHSGIGTQPSWLLSSRLLVFVQSDAAGVGRHALRLLPLLSRADRRQVPQTGSVAAFDQGSQVGETRGRLWCPRHGRHPVGERSGNLGNMWDLVDGSIPKQGVSRRTVREALVDHPSEHANAGPRQVVLQPTGLAHGSGFGSCYDDDLREVGIAESRQQLENLRRHPGDTGPQHLTMV